MGSSSSTPDVEPLREHVHRTANGKSGRSAVILGASGATGKFILSYLICSPEWSKITIIHRRQLDLNAIAAQCKLPQFTDSQTAKVTQHTVDMTKLAADDTNAELFKEHDVAICVLGTKRATAGSAEAFRAVDLYMVRDAAKLARSAGVGHFSLLTSKGANANLWSNDWKVGHGLLYLKVKGDAEAAVLSEQFSRTSIFRPGVLARDGNTEGGMMSKLDVRDLAAVMLFDAECAEREEKAEEKEPKEYESACIYGLVRVSRENFNAVCVEEKTNETETETEVEVVDKIEEKGDEKEDETQTQTESKVESVESAQSADAEKEAIEADKEVVEKQTDVDEENVQDVEEAVDEVGAEDKNDAEYVEVDNQDSNPADASADQ